MDRKRRYIYEIAATFIISLMIGSCAYLPASDHGIGPSAEKVDEIAGKVTLISLKVENKVRSGENLLSSEELKSVLANSNRTLFSYFEGLALEFQIQGKHAAVLVCNKDHNYMIVEDSACTKEIDRKRGAEDVPCSFSLKLSEICMHQ